MSRLNITVPRRNRGALASRLAAACVLLWLSTGPVSADQALIANAGVDLESVSLNTSRLLFSMQLDRLPDGTSVRVFVLPDNHPVHRAFSKNELGLYPRQLRRVWDRQLYSGTGQVPETVADEDAMRRAVAGTPGAIGYLSRENIDDTVRELQISR